MPLQMDPRTKANLKGVHPDLVKVVEAAYAISAVPFIVIHGLRTEAQESCMVASGRSETMHSRHLPNKEGYACAVDVAADPDGAISWETKDYSFIHGTFVGAAHRLNIPIEWGGDWVTLKDLGHFQLPWAEYP